MDIKSAIANLQYSAKSGLAFGAGHSAHDDGGYLSLYQSRISMVMLVFGEVIYLHLMKRSGITKTPNLESTKTIMPPFRVFVLS
jgi:hypothetical protein